MRRPGIFEKHTILTYKIAVLKGEYENSLISRGMRVLKGESEKYMILTESQVSGPPQESETCRPGICLSGVMVSGVPLHVLDIRTRDLSVKVSWCQRSLRDLGEPGAFVNDCHGVMVSGVRTPSGV